jgi:hypothetical protein
VFEAGTVGAEIKPIRVIEMNHYEETDCFWGNLIYCVKVTNFLCFALGYSMENRLRDATKINNFVAQFNRMAELQSESN